MLNTDKELITILELTKIETLPPKDDDRLIILSQEVTKMIYSYLNIQKITEFELWNTYFSKYMKYENFLSCLQNSQGKYKYIKYILSFYRYITNKTYNLSTNSSLINNHSIIT
ncbi:hypothetical protein DEFDS_P064 (plasmid) [Deferribacter desulfuricans SSM1]|uniref:Uncharacterized protein n=1 Tax=Deferribacter desulfuricans (strain DSM 14783 / JCM 11476 / NBRC 101012 / SSM1) TaxID=639282 RepID=D3PEP6_DEFDS|nr:hypothetical protein [Deferribacter desulfuricans]BAI81688.1 hypothetical protein DEFDS_P064 [Deferribacter desulfuricans SSM1]